jgi:DNA repair protein RadC
MGSNMRKKLVKGSKAAKDFMAKIRAKKGKPKTKAKADVAGWNKGSTRFIEKSENPVSNKKNIRVSRIENGTFKTFKTLPKSKNLDLFSITGYAPQKEIIIGKVSTERKLKDLAPQVKLRISRGKGVETIVIDSASKSVEVFKKYITKNMIETQEFFAVMYLNNANKCLGVYLVGQGGFTAVVTEKRLIMSGALLIGCTGFILCHNHPSGNLKPSNADIDVTKNITKLANEHDVRVIDHVIITKDSYYSFAENGMLR